MVKSMLLALVEENNRSSLHVRNDLCSRAQSRDIKFEVERKNQHACNMGFFEWHPNKIASAIACLHFEGISFFVSMYKQAVSCCVDSSTPFTATMMSFLELTAPWVKVWGPISQKIQRLTLLREIQLTRLVWSMTRSVRWPRRRGVRCLIHFGICRTSERPFSLHCERNSRATFNTAKTITQSDIPKAAVFGRIKILPFKANRLEVQLST